MRPYQVVFCRWQRLRCHTSASSRLCCRSTSTLRLSLRNSDRRYRLPQFGAVSLAFQAALEPVRRLRWVGRSADALLQQTAWLVLCLGLTGCQARQASTGPSIDFSKIPPAAQGGRERVDTIAGHVSGARPDQKIVIYARSGPWWVQPWPDRPFIPIRADSTWSTETHLGHEYAALLVDPSYRPPPTMDVAPAAGGAVALVKIVKGVGSLPPLPTKPLRFSGYDWKVQTSSQTRGGAEQSVRC